MRAGLAWAMLLVGVQGGAPRGKWSGLQDEWCLVHEVDWQV